MSPISPARIAHQIKFGQARDFLEALHFYGYTVTIHSPKTSPNGLYAVSAYGVIRKRQVILRASAERLETALRDAALQLGRPRLRAYVRQVLEAER